MEGCPHLLGHSQDQDGMAQSGGEALTSLSQSLVTAGALMPGPLVGPGSGCPATRLSTRYLSALVGREAALGCEGPRLGPSANFVGAESTLGFLEGREGLFAR